jgi:anti-sigma factor RsiW
MHCGEFEEQLVEYAELTGETRARVDAHVARCAGCREFLEALREVDAALTSQFAGREVSSAFAPAVRQRIQRDSSVRQPSWVPEILDFVGWGAIVALIATLAWWISPQLPVYNVQPAFFRSAPFAAAAVFLAIAFLIGLRSFADLKH